MLPTICKKNKKQLLQDINNPGECIKNNPGQLLIGIVNIKTGKVHLLPCIQDKVWLEIDEDGNYINGWKFEKFMNAMRKGEPLPRENIEEYNKCPYPPRIISYSFENTDEALRTHTFMLEVLGELSERENYRGFSVRPGDSEKPTNFIWQSMSLNNKSAGIKSSDKGGMREEHQQIVRNGLDKYLLDDSSLDVIIGRIKKEIEKYKDKLPEDSTEKSAALKKLIDICINPEIKDSKERFQQLQDSFWENKKTFTDGKDERWTLFYSVVSKLFLQGVKAAYTEYVESTKELENVSEIESAITQTMRK